MNRHGPCLQSLFKVLGKSLIAGTDIADENQNSGWMLLAQDACAFIAPVAKSADYACDVSCGFVAYTACPVKNARDGTDRPAGLLSDRADSNFIL